MNIEHVRQEDDSSCLLACIAMVAGVSFEEAKRAVQECGGGTPVLVRVAMRALVRLNVLPTPQLGLDIYHGKTYIVSVPSLNHPGLMHSIVIDLSEGKRDAWQVKVYDPNEGREGVLAYDTEQFIEGVMSWGDLVEVERV